MSTTGGHLVHAMLDGLGLGPVAPTLRSLVDVDAAAPHLAGYKLNPVLRLGPTATPVRLALADLGEADAWEQRVRAAWPDPKVAAFLALARPGTRRMIDTDGAAGVLYLDDLQDHGPVPLLGATPALPAPLMCATLDVATGARGWITRHQTRPQVHSSVLAEGLEQLAAGGQAALAESGAGGLWGQRWADGNLHGVLWVSEARWRGTVDASARLVDALGGGPAWQAARAVAEAWGWQAYADAIEIRAEDGAPVFDLTVGWLPAEG